MLQLRKADDLSGIYYVEDKAIVMDLDPTQDTLNIKIYNKEEYSPFCFDNDNEEGLLEEMTVDIRSGQMI